MKISNLFYLKYILDFATAWTGWWDQPKEGEMVSITSSEPLSQQSFAPWRFGEPNGERIENCVNMQRDGLWNDINCASKMCVACQIPTTPIFLMRGKVKLTITVIYRYLLILVCLFFTIFLLLRTLFWIII